MAMQPRIARPATAARIPLPNRGPDGLVQGLDAVANAAQAIAQDNRQTRQQLDSIAYQNAKRVQDEEDNRLITDRGAEFARMHSRIEEGVAQLRQSAARGGAGHDAKVQDLITSEMQSFDAGFSGNERVRQRFGDNLVAATARIATREKLWQMDQTGKMQGEDADAFLALSGNQLTTDFSEQAFAEKVTLWNSMVDALAMNDDVKAKVRRDGINRLTRDGVSGMFAQGRGEDVGKLVEAGFFNDLVDDVAPIQRQVTLERERAVREAELVQAETARAADERLAVITAMAKDGTASDDDLREGEALARQYGKPIDQYEIGVLRVENATAKSLANASLPQIDTAIVTTEARIAKAGDKASASDRIALQTMKDVRETRAKETGARYKAALKDGPQGRMSVLADLDRYDPATRFEVANEAEAGLGYVALLGPALRPLAVEGREVRKQQPDLAPKDKISVAMRAATGRVGRRLGSEYGPVMETASDIYAAWAAQRGQTAFDGKVFDSIVSGVMGAQRRPDGSMQGGLGTYRGEKVQLPGHLSNGEFASAIARSPFTSARYGNGKPADKNFIINSMVPEMVDELEGGRTVYRFVDGTGGTLRNDKGGEYRLIIETKTR